MNSLLVYQLPSLDKTSNIIKCLEKNDIKTTFSQFYKQPQINNGFIIYMHQTKDRMKIVNDPKFKGKTFYHVTNPFEHIIADNKDNDNDIASYSKIYFEETQLNIVSRAFYKLWEILMLFDPVPKTGPIVSAHLAEAPGSFVQALMFYREKFYKDNEKDEHFTISLEDQDVPTFKKDFKHAYSKVKIFEQDGGDLTTKQSITKFEKFSKKADFITADGGFNWLNENFQEQESYRLILGEIITAFKIQKPGGSFVLKIFEVYTDVSIKLLMLLSSTYEEVFIIKPFTSRPSNSERYVICKNYIQVSPSIIEKLMSLLDLMNKNHEKGLEISNLFSDIPIPINYRNNIIVSSSQLMNLQFIAINKIITFIRSNDYYGEQYHKYLAEQKEANDFWAQTFYPIGTQDFKNVRKLLSSYLNNMIEMKQKDINDFITSIDADY